MRKSFDEMLAGLRSSVREVINCGVPQDDALDMAYKEELKYMKGHLHQIAFDNAYERLRFEAAHQKEIDSTTDKILKRLSE